jgi:hypothetical protein
LQRQRDRQRHQRSGSTRFHDLDLVFCRPDGQPLRPEYGGGLHGVQGDNDQHLRCAGRQRGAPAPEHADEGAGALTDGEFAFYRCYAPTRVALPTLVPVAGSRWAVQC